MTDYFLHNLYPQEFEGLICEICQEVLGTGTISFADGQDGGRDARFNGTSNKFPSESEKWRGKFIIQAKRKASPIASCNDSDFKREILEKEVPKIKKLIGNGECEIYILFTSRSYAANSGERLLKELKEKLGIEKVEIIGKEVLTRYLNTFPEIAKRHNLIKYADPIRFNSEDIKQIIFAFHDSKDNICNKINEKEFSQEFLSKKDKNELNDLSEGYFKSIQEQSLPYFEGIKSFLENPKNKEFLDCYREIIDELKFKISAKREEYKFFDEIFSEMYDFVLENHPELKNIRRLIHTLLHYMYWHCDIGENVKTN